MNEDDEIEWTARGIVLILGFILLCAAADSFLADPASLPAVEVVE